MGNPIFLSDPDVLKLKSRAKEEMQKGREDVINRMARSAERGWKYGEGKKTALKVGVGVGAGLGIAGIGVATHGLGIPVIAGLAIGGFTVGQMSDTAFGKLWGRQYTGGERTQEWLNHGRVIDTSGKSKLLEERAHKTVRRAFQHYRTAQEKAQTLPLMRPPNTCEQAFGMMTDLLHVKRHLDKARLYLFPALLLSHHVLEYYEKAWQQWDGKDDAAAKGRWHPEKFCVISSRNLDACVYTGNPAGPGRPPIVWNRGTLNVHHEQQQLDNLAIKLGIDPVVLCRHIQQLSLGTRRMFEDAEREYDEHRVGAKLKHSYVNQWQRKTTAEQVGFAVKKGASVGLAGATIGVQVPSEAIHGISVLVDMGFTALDLGIGEGSEPVEEALLTAPQQPDLESQRDGAKAGAGAQEGLRKAAVHLWESGNAWQKIIDANGGVDFSGHTCAEATEYLRQVYKIEHHLVKSQNYIHETIETITILAEAVERGLVNLTAISNLVFFVIDAYMNKHTWHCVDGRCYYRIRTLMGRA